MDTSTSTCTDNTLCIVFENDRSEINIDLLINSLKRTTTLIHSVNQDLGLGDDIDIKVKPFKKGSFEINLELVRLACSSLFSPELIGYTSDITTVVQGLFALTGFLQGKRPKKVETHGEQIYIVNESGATTYIDNRTYNTYYNSEPIRKQVEDQYKDMGQHPDVTGFRVESGKKKVTIKREEFAALAESAVTNNEAPAPHIQTLENVELLILRPSFDKKLPWDFLYDGRKISARVRDETIWDLVNQGESFSKGSHMLVDLEEVRTFDSNYNTHVINKDSYHVLRFKKHLPAQRNTASLFDDSEE